MQKKNRLRLVKIAGVVIFNLVCFFSIIYVIAMSGERKQAIGEEMEVKVIKEFDKPAPIARGQTPNHIEGTDTFSPIAVTDGGVSPLSRQAQQVQQPPQAQQVQQPAASSQSGPYKPAGEIFLVDDFTGKEIQNRIGSRANIYTMAPSRAMVSRREDIVNGNKKKVLMIKYDKKNTGGPNGMGGWCGYYSLIKNEKTGEYLDGTGYKYITFWVKGDKGDGENFMVGLADEHWDKIGDSLKAEEVGVYLEKGKIIGDWQKARIPLEVFFLDHAHLSAISINFEADCFPEGAGFGVVFIADLALEK